MCSEIVFIQISTLVSFEVNVEAVSLCFNSLFCVCSVNPTYGCQIEINCMFVYVCLFTAAFAIFWLTIGIHYWLEDQSPRP